MIADGAQNRGTVAPWRPHGSGVETDEPFMYIYMYLSVYLCMSRDGRSCMGKDAFWYN